VNSSPNSDPAAERPAGGVPLFIRFIATGACVGYVPWASGTFGTLVGALPLLAFPAGISPWILVVLSIAGLFAGAYASGRVAAVTGHQLTATAAFAKSTLGQDRDTAAGHADPSIVVIDEIVGMWVTMLFLPLTPAAVGIGFVAFRAMDIFKPEPARTLERLSGGWGIMLDDVMAGIYANLATRALLTLATLIF
jgi:phosphatidylglycerophosphatase A